MNWKIKVNMRKLILVCTLLMISTYINAGLLYKVINKDTYPNDTTSYYTLKYLYIINGVKYEYKEDWIKDTFRIKSVDTTCKIGDIINIELIDRSE